MKYPEYFPQDCPPEDAQTLEIEAYRGCQNNVITRDDFKSYYELGKKCNKVEAYGVSLFTDFREVQVMMAMPNFRLNHPFIAKGITKSECGEIKYTGKNHKSHITWWLYEDSTPEAYFQIIEEQDNG